MKRLTVHAENIFYLVLILLAVFFCRQTVRAAYGEYCTVTLVLDDTQVLKYIPRGKILELPSAPNTRRKSFIGWSHSDSGSLPVEYLPGSFVPVHDDRVFYAVYYEYEKDKDISADDIPSVKRSKYQEVIFVGDSRIRRAMSAIGTTVLRKKKIFTVAGSLFTLEDFLHWGEQTSKSYSGYLGERDLIRLVKAHYTRKGKPIAVVFCLGVNDLKGVYTEDEAAAVADTYLKYFPALEKKLSKYSVRFFFMSVNPVCGDKVGAKSPLCLRAFNMRIRSKLPAGWKYINTYSELMRKGFAPVETNIEDGTHYSQKTYIKIYTYAMKKINAS